MNGEANEVTHPKFRMRLRDDGIVEIRWVTGVTMSLEDAVAATAAMSTLTNGRPSPLLVDAHDAGPQDRSARTEFVRRGDLVSAVAILISTPLSRMMSNFFLTVSKPRTTTRLFADESSALRWLRGFIT